MHYLIWLMVTVVKINDIASEKFINDAKKIRKHNLFHKKFFPISIIGLTKQKKVKSLNNISFKHFEGSLDELNHEIRLWEKCCHRFLHFLSKLDVAKTLNEDTLQFYSRIMEEINILNVKDESSALQIIGVNSTDNVVDKIRVAVANIEIRDSVFSQEALKRVQNKPFSVGKDYEQKLQDIVNEAIKHKVKLLVLPELSVPLRYIVDIMVDKSIKEGMAIVCGLQHIICGGHALNIQVTILPFIRTNKIKDAFVDFRLKKFYSPKESRELHGLKYIVPEMKYEISNIKKLTEHFIYHWNSIYFSSLNCYEFASIDDRCKFKSNVDLIAISEWNPDTSYFSNLLESAVNDIHCFAVQANTSQYGDSRVIAPKGKDEKNIIQVKGGKNHFIIYDDIDIKGLRNFQLKEYELQRESKSPNSFKPTPPLFNKSVSRLS